MNFFEHKMSIMTRITKLFRPRYKKTLGLVKPKFSKYRPRLEIIEHILLKLQVKF